MIAQQTGWSMLDMGKMTVRELSDWLSIMKEILKEQRN